MKTVDIKLSSIQDVRDFVDIVTGYCSDVDLTSGRYTVDGKSIMGIFSLDLLSPITMTIHNDECGDLLEKVEKFIIK
ncbi:MAG: HPr family phosphocarrier protein [Ruminococcaceae bacterium]|nr:HPr family phosphocarrier protein [Oscillospiraceae bacterium]